LWGFPGFENADVEITVPLGRQPRVAGIVVHRSGLITDADVGDVEGIPCMRAARTIVDLSGRLTVEALERTVDDALRAGVLTIGGLGREIRRFLHIAPGRSPKALERVLRDRVPGFEPSKSELERRVYRVIVASGLPEPVRQYKVELNGSTYYLDMAYPEARVAIEVDGYLYRRERGPFDTDRARQNALVLAQWTVLRFTSRSSDEDIVRDLTDALFVKKPAPG
jgi:very-short-patch-repair endonuclease